MERRSRLGRGLVAITCCLTLLGAGVGRAAAATTALVPVNAYIVVDAGTGQVIASQNDHIAYHPASTTKIMTALTAVERLPPDATIDVSPLAAAQPASKIGMLAGQKWSFNDALASMLIVSANDAAYAIALTTGGSLAGFARDETVTARQLGLKDSTFNDPAGLDDGDDYDGGPLMSAYDIAITARNALRVPMIAHFAASPSYDFVGPDGTHHTLVNHNKLVSEHLYPGANGFKTGFTNKASHTLIATATRNGRTMIAVILGTEDAYGWAEHLLDVGFATAPGHGTGEVLPAPRVTTYAARQADMTAFEAMAASSAPSATAPPLPDRAPASSIDNPSAAPTTVAQASASAGSAVRDVASGAASTSHGGGGLSTTTVVIGFLLLVLAILYVLRVRAVRRARARRLARRRATQGMMRRGGLPVVDGRYRTGTRVGKPVESHVQIRRESDPGEAQASG